MSAEVVLVFTAFSNISYRHTYETGMTRDEWDALSDKERGDIYDEAVWSDIEVVDEDQP